MGRRCRPPDNENWPDPEFLILTKIRYFLAIKSSVRGLATGMLAQVRKLVGTAAGGDLAGRFGAWWEGRDYVPPAEGESAGAEAARPEARPQPEAAVENKPAPKTEPGAESASTKTVEVAPEAPADAGTLRVKALEMLWGEGRLSPGSSVLDCKLLDAVLDQADNPGDIGFIGVDAALLTAFASRSERKALAAEWRSGCLPRLRELAPKADAEACDIDRPRVFGDSALEGVVSFEAFAYADHKAGLVTRVHRSLSETGRWVFLDTTRRTSKTPPEAFASAWAEPQLATADEIQEMLTLAGFGAVEKTPMTEQVLEAARAGYARLSQALENAATGGLSGREGALFLQELAWEAQSWRARIRALEGGALEVNLWIADKGEPLNLTMRVPVPRPSEEVLDLAIKPDDAGAADALFDRT
jgi:hypothetical protein